MSNNFSTAGNLSVGSNCSIGGNTTLSGPLTTSSTITASLGIQTSTINVTNNIVQSGGNISSGSGGINCNGNLAVLGTATFSSDLTTSGNINLNANILTNGATISPIELSYLDGGTQNLNTAITTIQTKVTDLTHSGTTNTMANNLVINGTTTTTGNLLLNGNIIANALTITPIELSSLDNISGNVQTLITTANTTIANHTTSITTINTNIANLQNQCIDLTHTSSTLDTFSQNLAVTNNLTAGTINSTGLLTANNGLAVTGSTTFSDVNITGTATFPTTNTGTSTGLSTYYNKNSLNEIDFLSRAGTSLNGGYNFYTSNSTSVPISLASISKAGKLTATSSLFSNSGSTAIEAIGDSKVTGNVNILGTSSSSFPKLNMIDYTGATTLASIYPSVNSINLDVSNTLSSGLIVSSVGTNLLKVDNQGHGTFNAGITSKTIKTYENVMTSSSQTKNTLGLAGTWNVSQHYTQTINVICPISIRLVTNNSTGNTSIFYSTLNSVTYTVTKNGLPFATGTPNSSTTLPKTVSFSSSISGSNCHTFLTTLSLSFVCNDDDYAAVYTVQLAFDKVAQIVNVSDIYVNTDVSTMQLGSNVAIYNSSTAGINYQSPSYSTTVNSVATVIGSTEVNNFFSNGEAHTMGNLTTHGSTFVNGNLQVNGDNTFLGSGNFPTAATGGTQGLSVYWNKSGNSIGEVDFLSRGQGGVGGYKFYTSTSTVAPTLLTTIDNSGVITTNGISRNNMYYKGQMGASMLNSAGATGSFPIFYSIADYTNFYPNKPSGMINTGNYASYNNNDRDDGYIIYPGFKLTVWGTNNFTGTIVLDVNNTSLYPIVVNPSSNDIGSSCKLYINNGNTELNY